MQRQGQIDLLKRLLHYVETRTTSLADAPWCNNVSVYTDPQHLAREQQQLFRGHPMLMGFASEWAVPGAYRTDDYAGVPILLVRGRDRRLRAFLNVCRHRGAKVAKDCGEARAFSCPYHAWSYEQARGAGEHELEATGRYVPRGLPHRLPAPEIAQPDPARQRRRLRVVRTQPPPYLPAPETRAPQGRST